MPDLNHPAPDNKMRVRRSADFAATILAGIEREVANGQDIPAACRDAGVSVPTYYRWRGRARGTGLHPDKTHQAILNAAKKVFLNEGYGASLDAVAKAARVARQTVYNKFGSKERLFSDVVH
jgi:hypothetical protein